MGAMILSGCSQQNNEPQIEKAAAPKAQLPGGADSVCGQIRRLDLSAVQSAPGVIAVLTAKDVPGTNDISPTHCGDDPVLDSLGFDFDYLKVCHFGLQSRVTYKDGYKCGLYEEYDRNGGITTKGTYNMGKQCGDWFVKGKPKTCLSRPCWPQRRKLDPKVPPLPASSGAGLPSDLLTVFCLSGAPRLSCGSGEGRGRMRACIKTNQ